MRNSISGRSARYSDATHSFFVHRLADRQAADEPGVAVEPGVGQAGRVGVQQAPKPLEEARPQACWAGTAGPAGCPRRSRIDRPAAFVVGRLADQHPAAGAAGGGQELGLRDQMRFLQDQQVERHARGRVVAEARVAGQGGQDRAHDVDALRQLFGQGVHRLLDGLGPPRRPRGLPLVLLQQRPPGFARPRARRRRTARRRRRPFAQARGTAVRPCSSSTVRFARRVVRRSSRSARRRSTSRRRSSAVSSWHARFRPAALRGLLLGFLGQAFGRRRQLLSGDCSALPVRRSEVAFTAGAPPGPGPPPAGAERVGQRPQSRRLIGGGLLLAADLRRFRPQLRQPGVDPRQSLITRLAAGRQLTLERRRPVRGGRLRSDLFLQAVRCRRQGGALSSASALPPPGDVFQAGPNAFVVATNGATPRRFFRRLLRRRQRLLAERAQALLEDQPAQAGRQRFRPFARGQAARGADAVAAVEALQHAIHGGGGRRQQQHALAAGGGLSDDLGGGARFPGAGMALNQAQSPASAGRGRRRRAGRRRERRRGNPRGRRGGEAGRGFVR